MRKIISITFASLLLLNCNQDKDLVQPTEGVSYSVEVDFNWSKDNHPIDFGEFPNNAHFSKVIGSVHKKGHSLFNRGSIASPGIKLMAETGGVSTLSSEIDAQVAQNVVYDKFIADASAEAKSSKVISNIKAKDDFQYVSLVSMIAPSPDWYIAKRNINLKKEDGNWIDSITADLVGYDSGTDSGETFTAKDLLTSPPDTIELFSEELVFGTVTIKKQ